MPPVDPDLQHMAMIAVLLAVNLDDCPPPAADAGHPHPPPQRRRQMGAGRGRGLHMLETEAQRLLRIERDKVAQLERDKAVLVAAIRGEAT